MEEVVLLVRCGGHFSLWQPRTVLLVHPCQDADGGFEVVAEGQQQVDVVEVLLAAEAVSEVVSWIDGGEHFLAMGTEEAIASSLRLVGGPSEPRAAMVTRIGRSLLRYL